MNHHEAVKIKPREMAASNGFMMSHGSVSEEIYGGQDIYQESFKRNKPTINLHNSIRNRESGTLGQSASKQQQQLCSAFTKDIDQEETKVPAINMGESDNIIGGNTEISRRP